MFTIELMQGLSQKDAATGKQVFNPGPQSGFEVMLQMRKDKFFQETGFTTEYVTTILREEKARKEKDEYEKAINKAKELEK